MPGETHQNFVLLFRRHPAVVFELARRAGAPVDEPYDRLQEMATEVDIPMNLGNSVRTDVALAGYIGDEPHRALVFEVQLGHDLDKQWSIVLYRAGVRYHLSCPAWAMFFSPDARVRELLHTQMFQHEPELRPRVVTPEMIEPIRDLDAALADYPWAVLSAVMHATSPDAVVLATVAIQALLQLKPKDFGRYIQLIADSVGEDIMQRARIELPPDDNEELSEWELRGSRYNRGLRTGREQGLEEGLEQGLEQGREQALEHMRTALRTVLEARGFSVDPPTHEWIANCTDLEALRDALVRAATTDSAQ